MRSERAEKLLREVYATPVGEGSPFVVTDFPTAELVKTAANSFLATKISFINAMAEVCEAAGGDVAKLAEAIGYDDRIGKKFLRAGIGFGGGCLPKDIRAFMARAGELGADQALTFLREVDSINMRRRGHMVELAREAAGRRLLPGQAGRRARRHLQARLRRRPGLARAQRRRADPPPGRPGHGLRPQGHGQRPRGSSRPSATRTRALEAVRGADVVLHLTEWREFRELDPAALGEVGRRRHILDGRNALDPALWRKEGWTFRAMGRPTA